MNTRLQGIHIHGNEGHREWSKRQITNTPILVRIDGGIVTAMLNERYPDGDVRVGYEGDMYIIRAVDIIGEVK